MYVFMQFLLGLAVATLAGLALELVISRFLDDYRHKKGWAGQIRKADRAAVLSGSASGQRR